MSSADSQGNISTQTDADGNVTTFKYDALNRLVTVIDPLLNMTRYGYDLAGRLLSESRPSGRKTLYSYDAKGRTVGRQDPKGQVTTYGYRSVDDALTSIRYYASSSSLLASRTVTFSLDGNGNELAVDDDALYSLTNGKPIYVNAFDALNRMTTQLANHVGKVVAYAYDPFGNRTSLAVREGSAGPGFVPGRILFELSYAYDDLNRVSSITQYPGLSAGENAYGFTYFPSGRVATKSFPNRIQGAYTYFKDGNVASIGYVDTRGNNLLNLTYGDDPTRGLYSSQLRQEPGGVSINRTFSYDKLGQLTGVTRNTSPYEGFQYDAVGNRVYGFGPGNLNGVYSYNQDNELLQVSVGGSPVTSFAWDANGNQTQMQDPAGTRAYGYEFENRLATFTFTNPQGQAVTTASYLYDPTARRLSMIENGQETRFLWDGGALLGELDPSANTPLRTYAINPQSLEPLGTVDAPPAAAPTICALITDHLQTPLILTDATSSQVWRTELTSFGGVENRIGSVAQLLRFPGQYQDPETDDLYNVNRAYAEPIGMFRQTDPDPYEGDIGLPGRLSAYSYSDNSPIGEADPWGLFHYKPGVPPVAAEMAAILSCMDAALGRDLGISGGAEKIGHTVGSEHYVGKAADISFRMNPGLRDKQRNVMCAAKRCGAGFAQTEEAKSHFHVQVGTGKNRSHGEIPCNDQGCK